ncbi:GNAT family protein [Fictibacillus sp. CENA-BCM004]|uniref:GNAT family protein n=2 Tax=Fictibacillus terranigra TaxID=3058424 RepID=A0ABT8E8G2_9BACL|nr:GNAT family protein [Fictibacillus sp. CENA-BCM004]MDN4074211.1 GNAT family protein [Fictibacillus sp. CENA-BCM004]
MRMDGEHFFLKLLDPSDSEALLQLEVDNREFFQMYSPLRNDEFYTLEGQRERLEVINKMREMGHQYTFGIFLKGSEELIGDVSLFKIERGPAQTGMLGYCLDHHHNGKGYMTKVVKRMITFAFNVKKLHRIEAGVMPQNAGSIKVLEKAGFHREGIAVKSIKINGRWEDHQMLAIINDAE